MARGGRHEQGKKAAAAETRKDEKKLKDSRPYTDNSATDTRRVTGEDPVAVRRGKPSLGEDDKS